MILSHLVPTLCKLGIFRKENTGNKKLQSTIRYFENDGEYDAEEFVAHIKNLDKDFLSIEKVVKPDTLYNLWSKNNIKKSGIFRKENSEWYVRLTMDPSEQYGRFGKVQGNICRDSRFPDKNYDLVPIWYANDERWYLVCSN